MIAVLTFNLYPSTDPRPTRVKKSFMAALQSSRRTSVLSSTMRLALKVFSHASHAGVPLKD